MKRTIKILVATAVIFALCGCSKSSNPDLVTVSPRFITPAVETTPTAEPTPTETPTETPPPTAEPTPEPTTEIHELASDYEVNLIAWTIWGEYSGCTDWYKLSTIAWCILNRVDEWERSIESIVNEENQFYTISSGCPDYCYEIAEDVVERWEMEHAGYEDVGRTLPEGYMWYGGDGTTNWMRNAYTKPYDMYYWWLPDPYV